MLGVRSALEAFDLIQHLPRRLWQQADVVAVNNHGTAALRIRRARGVRGPPVTDEDIKRWIA